MKGVPGPTAVSDMELFLIEQICDDITYSNIGCFYHSWIR